MLFAAFVIVGCSKNDGVSPQKPKGDSLKTPVDTAVTIKLSHDDSIHLAAIKLKQQYVATSVSGTNLILKFDENVDLFFSEEGYRKISAVHLLEDFKNSMLAGIDYTTVAEAGNTTLNWVDDNLNNVILKKVTDTVINHNKMVRINVHRPFTFFKICASNQQALNQQLLFTKKTNDSVTFKSYSYYNQKNYLPTSCSAKLVYVK